MKIESLLDPERAQQVREQFRRRDKADTDHIWRGLTNPNWASAFKDGLPRALREPWSRLSSNQQVLYYLRRMLPGNWGRRELAAIVHEASGRGFLTWQKVGGSSTRGLNSINEVLRDGDDRLFELILPVVEEILPTLDLPPRIQQTLHLYAQAVPPRDRHRHVGKDPARCWRQACAARLREAVFEVYCGRKRPKLCRRVPVLEEFGADLSLLGDCHIIERVNDRQPAEAHRRRYTC